MKFKSTILAIGFVLAAQGAFALTANEVAAQMEASGYTWVEVKTGPSQIKVEAVKGSEKVEIVYDAATGDVLRTETGSASGSDRSRTGVSYGQSSRDFVSGATAGGSTGYTSSSNDDGANDDNGNDDNGNDNGTENHGSDDNGSDDNGSDDNGSDDNGSDDNGSDDHGSDDHGSDDHSSDDNGSDDNGSDDD